MQLVQVLPIISENYPLPHSEIWGYKQVFWMPQEQDDHTLSTWMRSNHHLSFILSPEKSTSRTSLKLQIPQTSRTSCSICSWSHIIPVCCIVYYPLILRVEYTLIPWCSIRSSINPTSWTKYWSDEASFEQNGHVKTHTSYHWATGHLHHIMITQLNQPGATVWDTICSICVVTPVFFDETVTQIN